jgi:hypothetical protein
VITVPPNAAGETRASPTRLLDEIARRPPARAPRTGRLRVCYASRWAAIETLSRYDEVLMGHRVLIRGTAYLLGLGLLLCISSQSICAALCHLGVCCAAPVEEVVPCHACERQASAGTSGAQCCSQKLQLARLGEVRLAGKIASIGADAVLVGRTWLTPAVSEEMTAPRTVSAPESLPAGAHIRPDAPRAPPVVRVEQA